RTGLTFGIYTKDTPAPTASSPGNVRRGDVVPFKIEGKNLDQITQFVFASDATGGQDNGIAISNLVTSSSTMTGTLDLTNAQVGRHKLLFLTRLSPVYLEPTNVLLDISSSSGVFVNSSS